MGASRQCAHRWITRYRTHGTEGLTDRSSKPATSPTRTPESARAKVLSIRKEQRVGRDEIARTLRLSPVTVSRIIARAGVPALHELDPGTGIRLRATRRTTRRYERPHPGDLIHIDVKKLGRIPNGCRWRVEGRTP